MTLSARSWERLEGVHADLVKVIELAALGPVGFVVTEGLRTRERQATLVMAGKSRTMNSRHLTGHAVDLAVVLPGNVLSWDKDDYKRLSVEVKLAAVQLGIPIRWGGEAFGSFYDGPHFDLSPAFYPAVPNLQPDGQVTQT